MPPEAAERTAIYFISDLHLEPQRNDITSAFLHFLDHIKPDASALYILGDFFEAWIGDDDNSRFVNSIKNSLKELIECGVPVYFCHGNRDFVLGRRFARETGVNLLQEEEVIDLFGQNALLLHGDQLCTDDVEYQAFRTKVRDPNWQSKMLAYPLWVRKLIATYLRHRSRKAHKGKSMEIMDVNQGAVEKTLEKYTVNIMIHGHTHRPAEHELSLASGRAKRIVLGDWDKSGWYYRVDQASAELISFPLTTR